MTISKERLEELRDKLLVSLRSELDGILHYAIEEAGKDQVKFLFDYVALIKQDYRAGNGRSSSIGYSSVDFPLNIREFTEEELKYLKFYDEPNNHRRLPKED
ncbi:hypothetical protein EBU94_08245 [bacterium]|nr:hypothetical protein [bacterium]